jgi:hypothetical protein
MAVSIPCTPSGQARWTQRTTIAGREYAMTFEWLQRDGHWWWSIADQDGVPIASGVKLVCGAKLLEVCRDLRAPAGPIVVYDTTGAYDADPGFDDLGGRFALVYFDPTELAP